MTGLFALVIRTDIRYNKLFQAIKNAYIKFFMAPNFHSVTKECDKKPITQAF